MASANIPVTARDATTLPRLARGTVEAHLFGDRRGGLAMPDFFDQAKKLASEHEDLVDSGLDKASDMAKEKTGGKYDKHIETAEDKLEGFLGVNTDDDNR
jgi:hypothetical protein